MSFVTTAPLNQGQKDAETGFLQFMFGDDKEMIISGPGGYGKTHLVQHLIDKTIPHYFDTCKLMGSPINYDDVGLTATTNKAASVLMSAANVPTSTIQSYLHLTVMTDFTTGDSKLKKRRDFKVHSRQIIFVDECSFIDTPLYSYIQEGFHKCKVVYVGDHCQMAPVREKLSPVYRNGLRFYELTEPMRNAEQPALMALCNQLREQVETGEFKPIQIVPGVIDHVDNLALDKELHLNFAQQTMDFACLAYTNARVVQYNDHIRTIRGLPDELTVGEVVINNSAIELGKDAGMLSVDAEVTIHAIGDIKTQTLKGCEFDYREMDVARVAGFTHTVKVPTDFNHFNDILKYLQRQKAFAEKEFLKKNFADLRPHDARTVYKAQGSTYHTVYIDLTDISKCRVPDQVARMLYVACSRPRTRIVFYGVLDAKYGGLLF